MGEDIVGRPSIDLTGKIINKIKFVNVSHFDKSKKRIWNCVCHCGKSFKAHPANVKSKSIKGCGCVRRKICSKLKEINKKWNTIDRTMYPTWQAMIARCYNKKNIGYKNYGGRGIKVYHKWLNNFDKYADWITKNLGERPSDYHSIDRIDNDKGYYPSNLRWASKAEQAHNRKSNKITTDKAKEIRESNLTRKELAKKYKVMENTIGRIINNKRWIE